MPNFQTARIFSDNMVMQFGKPLSVFGTGVDGTRITVSITGEEAAQTATIVRNGRWLAMLPPQPAQDCVELTVTDGQDTAVFRNVAMGAVWLAGGQSNMELELQNCNTGRESLENDNTPNVRFYYTMKKSIADDSFFESEQQMGWCDFSNKDSAKCWSAVGYYFAKELSERLGVVVGIIGCNWGGTSASAWMKREYADGETAVYFEEYDKATDGKSLEQLKQEYLDYQQYHAEWERKSAEYYNNTPDPTWDGCLEYCGENKYPGPPSPLNPMSPGVLHKSMVERVAPYTMTGVIWYQGESDDHRPEMYYKLLGQMIRCWRDDWSDDDLFFVIGQLPMHKWSADEDRKNWCVIREAQAKICRTVQNTALAVLTDCGEYNEIHPKDKKTPGHRFCLAALNGFYHVEFTDDTDNESGFSTFSPEPYDPLWNTDSVDVFVSTGMSLEVSNVSGELTGFELMDMNGEWHKAAAEISERERWNAGEGSEILHITGVEYPCGVRYLWTNYTEDIPLRDGENGVPLPPFMFTKPGYLG